MDITERSQPPGSLDNDLIDGSPPSACPPSGFILRRLPQKWHLRDRRTTSLVYGFGGLITLALVLAACIPLEVWLVDRFVSRPPEEWFFLLIVGSIITPAIAALSAMVWAALFRFGSISLRFLLAVVLVVSTFLLTKGLVDAILGTGPDGFYRGAASAFFGFISGLAVVAVATQFWASWSLSEFRENAFSTAPLTIRHLMELTMVIAVGCAILSRLELTPRLWETLVVTFILGMGIGAALLLLMFGWLPQPATSQRNYLPLGWSWLLTTACCSTLMLFITMQTSPATVRWNVITLEIFSAGLLGLLFHLVVLAALQWLRGCGWRLVCSRIRMTREHFK